MMTNTYLPHVGGVARSVSTFSHEFRRLGHEVLVVAPEFEGRPLPQRDEALVERVPALQKFNGSDFSVRLPLAAALSDRIDQFPADIIHAHHPFLLGDSALRLATSRNIPILFTHHTRYEDYTHYVPMDSPALRQIAIELPTHFANLCDGVVAPSESIARLIHKRGVTVPVRVLPTGIDIAAFERADPAAFRRRFDIPVGAFLIGHVGRLAPEKNLGYLAVAVARHLQRDTNARFVVVGTGPSSDIIRRTFRRARLEHRLVLCGKLTGNALCQAYRAMNLFAFASTSETQGMVVAEAMAAGAPVVALNAPGVREVVRDGVNGLLLPRSASTRQFADALHHLRSQPKLMRHCVNGARETALEFDRRRCALAMLDYYQEIRQGTRRERLLRHLTPWSALQRRVALEWELVSTRTRALLSLVSSESIQPTRGA